MGLFTQLTLKDARILVADYGASLADIQCLAAGSVNSNFRLILTDGSSLFARIYEEQSAAGARSELQLLSDLADCGLPVGVPLRRSSGDWVHEHQSKPLGVYPWVHGFDVCLGLATERRCEALGRELANVHLATNKVSQVPEGRFGSEAIFSRLDRVDREAPRFSDTTVFLRERLEHYLSLEDEATPQGLIHGDLFRDNLLWKFDKNGEQTNTIAALLDFESASRGVFAYDVMVCLWAWCYGSDIKLDEARAFLRGYTELRELSRLEVQQLRVQGALACLRFASTRITDFAMRTPAGETPERDYGRLLERLRALEEGRLDRLFGEL